MTDAMPRHAAFVFILICMLHHMSPLVVAVTLMLAGVVYAAVAGLIEIGKISERNKSDK